ASAEDSQLAARFGRKSVGLIAKVPSSGITSVSKIWRQAQLSAPSVVSVGFMVEGARAASAIERVPSLARAGLTPAASAAGAAGAPWTKVRRVMVIGFLPGPCLAIVGRHCEEPKATKQSRRLDRP